METITNYTFADFVMLDDAETVASHIAILELLEPIDQFEHPASGDLVLVQELRDLTFGEVTTIRENLTQPTHSAVAESISLLTGLSEIEVYTLGVVELYSVLNGIAKQATELSNLEENELYSDDFSFEMEAVNASARMARFGALNVINSLAGDDVTKWSQIEELPYMVVFTKLKMDKERAAINKEVNDLQRRKQNV